jgi:hypothetical protein
MTKYANKEETRKRGKEGRGKGGEETEGDLFHLN